MEEPGRLQSIGSRRVGHDWETSLSFFTFHFHALEKETATHSSVLAWRIPGTGEPSGLPSLGSYRVGHDWSDLAAAAAVAATLYCTSKVSDLVGVPWAWECMCVCVCVCVLLMQKLVVRIYEPKLIVRTIDCPVESLWDQNLERGSGSGKGWEGCNKQSEARTYMPWQVKECEDGIETKGIQRDCMPGSLGKNDGIITGREGCCSVAKLCPTLCDPMICSTPGFSVLHYLPEFAQTHVHWVSDAIQPFHPLSPPSPLAYNLSQYQALKFRGQESTLKEEELWFWTWLGQDAKLCEGLPDSWKCRFHMQENRGVWIYREPVTTLGIARWSKRWCLKRGKPRVELWKFLHSRLIFLGFSKDGQRSRTVNNYIMKVEEEGL